MGCLVSCPQGCPLAELSPTSLIPRTAPPKMHPHTLLPFPRSYCLLQRLLRTGISHFSCCIPAARGTQDPKVSRGAEFSDLQGHVCCISLPQLCPQSSFGAQEIPISLHSVWESSSSLPCTWVGWNQSQPASPRGQQLFRERKGGFLLLLSSPLLMPVA